MILRNLIFEAKVVEQRLRAGLVPHHEQQASECSGEQQHRELWPAYNPNLALPQASTEGLFQQTRLITTVIPVFYKAFAIANRRWNVLETCFASFRATCSAWQASSKQRSWARTVVA